MQSDTSPSSHSTSERRNGFATSRRNCASYSGQVCSAPCFSPPGLPVSLTARLGLYLSRNERRLRPRVLAPLLTSTGMTSPLLQRWMNSISARPCCQPNVGYEARTPSSFWTNVLRDKPLVGGTLRTLVFVRHPQHVPQQTHIDHEEPEDVLPRLGQEGHSRLAANRKALSCELCGVKPLDRVG